MTDKQIIIDGIDVSGCSYGEIEKDIFKCSCEYNVRSASMFCKDNPNCYYKQLKAKEQECEELKSRLNCRCFDPSINNNRCISYNRIAEDYERDLKQLDQLKVELEQEKAVKETYLACYKAKHEDIEGALFKLKQTLTEIKEIAESEIDSKEVMVVQCMLNGSVDHKNKVLKQILQKLANASS